MFRYVALVWDVRDSRQAEAARSLTQQLRAFSSIWTEALDCAGLRVFCADARPGSLEPHVFAGSAGIVLGSLFVRRQRLDDDAPTGVPTLGKVETAQILESRGRWLIDNCWGNYVALLADPRTASRWVVKDPAGNLPCFSTSFRGLTVLFSAVADAVELGLRFTPNRLFLQRRLYGDEVMHPCEALNEVSQIHRGECAELDPRQQPSFVRRKYYWDPFSFPRSQELIEDLDQAARALRSTLRSCTQTLARYHESLLLRLSGGLDSSIVLSCLKGASNPVRLLSYVQYVPRTGSDPRRWARLAADHAGCEHIEVELVPRDIRLDSMLQMAPSAEPVSAMMQLATAALDHRLASERGASAIFTGDGGDPVFGSFCVGEVVPAYLRRHGPRFAVLRLASQAALVLQRTAWAILGRGVRSWLTGRPSTRISEQAGDTRKLVAEAVLRECRATSPLHPWLGGLSHEPWEAISKLGMLLATPDHYVGQATPDVSAPEIVAPIYSQPVIELCLRLPAYVLFAGGRDRGLARRAFTGDVPQPILNRTWKDRAGDFHEELVQRNLDWLREIFLDGILVKEGLLDRAAVERALSSAPTKGEVFSAEIMRHLDTEIWLRHWAARSSGAIQAA